MGNWVINIEGTGMHHNARNPKDADVLAEEVVRILREAGQHVEHCTITTGGRTNVTAVINKLEG